jgi:beta-mannosidase
MYDLTVTMTRKDSGEILAKKTVRRGFRLLKLVHSEKVEEGGAFEFIINNKRIMAVGSNWVPMDAFHSRDAQRYAKALELVKDIGCNILRCWGGNVYEDHEFFDFCDRNGIMVWQDFAMACRLYPETESFKKLLFDEAVKVIRKLRKHPSIILWSGDNEIDQVISSIYDPNKNTLTREVLPTAVRLNDIGRPYLASSPYISTEAYKKRGSAVTYPEDHLWGPRDYFKSDYYKNSKSHFVSETGYFGCPSIKSLKKFITAEKLWPYYNSEWILHSSDQNGNDNRIAQMEKQVKQLFGEAPENPEEFVTASQISQAEAKKYFIERVRVGRPEKTGIIWWNLLDGWPQMSDAVVDYYYDKKIAYGYIKRSQAPFVIAAGEISDWTLPIYACNDTLEGKSGNFTVICAETDEILFESGFEVGANQTKLLTRMPIYYSDHKFLIFEWDINGEKGINHYLCGYPPFNLEKYKLLMQKYGL